MMIVVWNESKEGADLFLQLLETRYYAGFFGRLVHFASVASCLYTYFSAHKIEPFGDCTLWAAKL